MLDRVLDAISSGRYSVTASELLEDYQGETHGYARSEVVLEGDGLPQLRTGMEVNYWSGREPEYEVHSDRDVLPIRVAGLTVEIDKDDDASDVRRKIRIALEEVREALEESPYIRTEMRVHVPAEFAFDEELHPELAELVVGKPEMESTIWANGTYINVYPEAVRILNTDSRTNGIAVRVIRIDAETHAAIKEAWSDLAYGDAAHIPVAMEILELER